MPCGLPESRRCRCACLKAGEAGAAYLEAADAGAAS